MSLLLTSPQFYVKLTLILKTSYPKGYTMALLLKKSDPSYYYKTTPAINMNDYENFALCIRFKAASDSVDGEPLLSLGPYLLRIMGTTNTNEYAVVLDEGSDVVLATFTVAINTEVEVYIHVESASVARVYIDGVQSGSDHALVGYDHSAYTAADLWITSQSTGAVLIKKLLVWLGGTLPDTDDILALATGMLFTDIDTYPEHAYIFDSIPYGYSAVLGDVAGLNMAVAGFTTTNKIIAKDPATNIGLLWRSTNNGNIYSSNGTTWSIYWKIRNFFIQPSYTESGTTAPIHINEDVVLDVVNTVPVSHTRYPVDQITAKVESNISFLNDVILAVGTFVDIPDNVLVKLDGAENATGNYFVTNELPFDIHISIPDGDGYYVRTINAVDYEPRHIQQLLTNGGNLLHADWVNVGTVSVIDSAITTRYNNTYFSLDYSADSYIHQVATVSPDHTYLVQMHVDKSVSDDVVLGVRLSDVTDTEEVLISVDVDSSIGMLSNPTGLVVDHYGIEDEGSYWSVWMVFTVGSTIVNLSVRPNMGLVGSLGLIGDVIVTQWLDAIAGPYAYNQLVMNAYAFIPAYEAGGVGLGIYSLSDGGWTTNSTMPPKTTNVINDTLVANTTKYFDVLRDVVFIKSQGLHISAVNNIVGGDVEIKNEGRYLKIGASTTPVINVDIDLMDVNEVVTTYPFTVLVSPIGRLYRIITSAGINNFNTPLVRGDNVLYDATTPLGGKVEVSATGIVSIDYTGIDMSGITSDTFAFNINGELEETYTHTL